MLTSKKVGIVDLGVGNVNSVASAVKRITGNFTVVSRPELMKSCEALIIPGVGSFGVAEQSMRKRGLDVSLYRHVAMSRPLLGICLGMQLLFEASEEAIGHPGLKLVRGTVHSLPVGIHRIGWDVVRSEPETANNRFISSNESSFFFNHNYYVVPQDIKIVELVCERSPAVPALVSVGSITGVQFHPERSQQAGHKFLANWLKQC